MGEILERKYEGIAGGPVVFPLFFQQWQQVGKKPERQPQTETDDTHPGLDGDPWLWDVLAICIQLVWDSRICHMQFAHSATSDIDATCNTLD